MQSPSFASVLITPDLVDHANAGAVLSDRVTTALGPEPAGVTSPRPDRNPMGMAHPTGLSDAS